MTHIINNSKDRICCSSCIGKSINTRSSLSNAEGSDHDWEKDLSKKNTRKSYKSYSGVHHHLKYDLFGTYTTQRIEIRFIPLKFFWQKSKIYKVTIAFYCTNGFLQSQKYFFCLACQTICCSSPRLRQSQKDFSNLFPWFWSYCHQRKTFSISIIFQS